MNLLYICTLCKKAFALLLELLEPRLKDFLKCCGLALWLDLFDQVLQT